jgi:hypothetical protein
MQINEFWGILHDMPEPKPVFFRLYHQDGVPLFYSMEDIPGTYVEIDAETFSRSSMHVRVRDGKLVESIWRTTAKLVPSAHGTPCHPYNVAIVVPETEPHQRWSKQTYETN